jgi:hypothetical protein
MENPRRHQSGFTLIETLIALGLGMIVIGAAIGVFNYSQNSYNIQEDVAAMQQDLRIAKSFIERDIRMMAADMADYIPLEGMTADDEDAFTFQNGAGEGGSDILTIRYVVPMPRPCGARPVGVAESITACDVLPHITLDENMMPDTSSTVNVADQLGNLPFNLWDQGCYCHGTFYDEGAPNGLDMEALITSPDGNDHCIVYITKVTNKTNETSIDTVQNRPIQDDDNYQIKNKVINTYPPGSTLSFFTYKPMTVVRYFVQEGVLMRDYDDDLLKGAAATRDPIAEHVEDLQFAFGLDTDGDNVVDYWADGSDANDLDGAGDLTDANKALVRAVRISVLGRTDRGRKELDATYRPAVEDHAAADASDHFRRRLSQVTVEVRNLTLESPEDATGGAGT